MSRTPRVIALFVLLLLTAGIVCGQSPDPNPGTRSVLVLRRGALPARSGSAEHFSGVVRVDPLMEASEAPPSSAAYVTFEPGARTNWHTHPSGQTLIVTAGTGRVQQWGGPIVEIRPGDVVWIPADVKHWHGASPGASMTHIAVQARRDGKSVDWLEAVTDDQYAAVGAEGKNAQPSVAQAMYGDVNPKLAALTDDVLYGEVWARTQLSPRDRSLVTVSALIAMNRPDQLRSHLALARKNGLTEDELIETITHLAFYAGWPSAVTATLVAKDVFRH